MILRNVTLNGVPGLDVQMEHGVITAIGLGLRGGAEIDGQGCTLLPGLIDHHCHIFASAAQASSLNLEGMSTLDTLTQAAQKAPPGTWLRAVACPRVLAQTLKLAQLDALVPHHPLRLQDQSGALWLLNSAALALVAQGDTPPCVERDVGGTLTGRIWRGDAWLGAQIGPVLPDFTALGQKLAAYGITALTDASAATTPSQAALLAKVLPQRLTLMSAGPLPENPAYSIGPVKILLDDRDLLDFDEFCARIAQARLWGRAVAVHCVTGAELALMLAAFETAGSRPGDRIEHGGIIPVEAIPVIAALGLTVVTQSGFIAVRGDRYRAEVEPEELPDLYRAASLLKAGIPVWGSSDAPYSSWDPWAAMRAAITRRTAAGTVLGPEERLTPQQALSLYLGPEIAVDAPADLCLIRAPGDVAATFIGGTLVYSDFGPPPSSIWAK